MTADELLAARALVDAASPGPWLVSIRRQAIEVAQRADKLGVIYGGAFWIVDPEEDDPGEEFERSAAFIAAARQLVPALLDHIATLTRERDEARSVPDNRFDCTECNAKAISIDRDGCCVMCGSEAIVMIMPLDSRRVAYVNPFAGFTYRSLRRRRLP